MKWPPPPRARGGPDFSAFNNFHHHEANRGHRLSDGEWHTRRLRLRGRRYSTHGRHSNAPQPAPGGASVSAKPHRPKEDSRDMDTWDQSPNSPPPKRRPSPTHPQSTDRPRSRNPRPHRRHPARLRPIGQGRSHSLELLERGSRSVPGDGPCRVPFTSDRSTSAGRVRDSLPQTTADAITPAKLIETDLPADIRGRGTGYGCHWRPSIRAMRNT